MVNALRPADFAEALRIRHEHRVIPFAGGTDLMVKHRRHSGLVPQFERPVLFLNCLQELRYITVEGAALVIGAGTTLTDLLGDSRIPSALKQSVAQMAAPAVRNVATLMGNICNASPAGDTLPALYCLNARLVLARGGEERRVNIEDFIREPGKTGLRDDELAKAVILPMERFDVVDYRKVGTRKANALSKLSFLGLVKVEEEAIQDVRIAFGAVAPTVMRSRQLEREITGWSKKELAQRRPELLDAYSRLIVPIDDQRSTAHYRRIISLRLLDRFLAEAI
jgi:xanthine dehydrogenase FAD-binding subunit